MTNSISDLTRRTPQEHERLSRMQGDVLRAMSDHAPNGRLRFVVDMETGAVEIEQPQSTTNINQE